MKSPVVRWLIALNILVLCGAMLAFFSQRHRQQQANEAAQAQFAQVIRGAWMNDDATLDERARLHVISQSVQRKQALTDDQLSLLLTEISKPNKRGIANVSHLTAVMCLDAMSLNAMRTPLSPSQKAILLNRLVPLLQIPDPAVSSGLTLTQMHKLEACDLLAQFDVREAIPQLIPLLDDPKPQVRMDAKRALKKLGYST